MTKEQQKISTRNRNKARKYFGIVGQPDLVLHHIDPSWKENDVERYIQWNPEDLVVMTRKEHSALHGKGENNPMYGVHRFGESNPFYGKSHSDETKATIGAKNKLHSHPNSPETLEKIRQALYKPVRCIETGIVYKSIGEAANLTGCCGSKISEVCNGHREKTGGYHWEFV